MPWRIKNRYARIAPFYHIALFVGIIHSDGFCKHQAVRVYMVEMPASLGIIPERLHFLKPLTLLRRNADLHSIPC